MQHKQIPPYVGLALYKASEIKKIEKYAANLFDYPLIQLMEKAIFMVFVDEMLTSAFSNKES